MFELIVIIWICLLVSVMVVLCYVCRKNYRRINLLKETLVKTTLNQDKNNTKVDIELRTLKSELTVMDGALYISVISDNVLKFREKVSIAQILGILMDKLGYTVEKGALAVKKVEEKK